jgi:hypothetical protein
MQNVEVLKEIEMMLLNEKKNKLRFQSKVNIHTLVNIMTLRQIFHLIHYENLNTGRNNKE